MTQIPDFTYMTTDEAINQNEFMEPPASFKSAVWKYFKLTKSRKLSVCNVCNTVMSYSGNTTNLQTHLRRHHPHIEICLGGQNTYSGGNSANTSKSSPVPVSSIFNSTESSSSDSFLSLNVNKLIPVGGSGKSWFITDAITKYLASDLRPVSVIEDPCFRNLIHILDPSYNLPATQQFSEIEIPRLYHSIKSNVKEKVSCADRVSLSTDVWTSKSNQNHVTVTCHYIDNDWQVRDYVLQTCVLLECYSGGEISSLLWHIAQEWDLQDILSAVVTDNKTCTNIRSLSHKQFETLLVCFAESLNKATLDGLSVPEVMDLLQKLRKIVMFFYMNENAAGILKQKQAILDVPQNNLMSDVPDRSTSSYNMLEQFLEQKSPICAALASKEMRKQTMDIVMLTDHEIVDVKLLVDLLKPMKMAMQAICEKSAPTLSVVGPLLSQLKGRMQTKDGDSAIIISVKEAILNSLQTCHTEKDMEFFYIASALDPRFKTLPFLTDVERLSVFSSLAVSVTELNKMTKKSDGSNLHSSNSTPFNATIQIKQEPSESGSGISMIMEMQEKAAEWDEPPAKRSALSSLFGDVFIEQQNRPKSVLTSAQEEVDRYKTENPTSLECNPLSWWKDHEGAYPLMAALAKSVLCIPGATVTSEVFTYSGDVYNIQRETLECTSVDMMTFIKKNMEFQL